MNKLNISNNSKDTFLFEKEFVEILNAFKEVMQLPHFVEVDVLITDNKEIQEISKEYRNIDKPTDVLSFPIFDFINPETNLNLIGEIVLSSEKIQEQAQTLNHSLKREFCFLYAHALVHLAGYDHKASDEEEKQFNG